MSYSVDFLRGCYERIPETVEQLDAYIQGITTGAYANVHLLSNDVLSRNPHGSDLFRKALFQEDPRSPSIWTLSRRLLQYYLHSTFEFVKYCSNFFAARVRLMWIPARGPGMEAPQYIIDTFVVLDDLLQKQKYTEQYFPGLGETLEKYGRHYAVIPRFYGGLTISNLWRALKIMNSTANLFITEFDLITLSDLLRVAWFILRYPFDVLLLTTRIPQEQRLGQLIAAELVNTLERVTFYGFIRYLVGRRLGRRLPTVTVISWCENQVVDKNFYRGLKETSDQVYIIGCQCYVAYPPYLNQRIAESDKQGLATPDSLLMNGSAFLDLSPTMNRRLGASFRNAHVFAAPLHVTDRSKWAVFLSYFHELNAEVIALCSQVLSIRTHEVAVTLHPTHIGPEYLPPLPESWYYASQCRSALLDEVELVITSESSTAVEAAALGASVIIIASQSTFTCNPMLDLGKGEIWEIAFSAAELELALDKLLEIRATQAHRITALAARYRSECFVEPSAENIALAMQLRSNDALLDQ